MGWAKFLDSIQGSQGFVNGMWPDSSTTMETMVHVQDCSLEYSDTFWSLGRPRSVRNEMRNWITIQVPTEVGC